MMINNEWNVGCGIVVEGVQSQNDPFIYAVVPRTSPLIQGELTNETEEVELSDVQGTDEIPQPKTKVQVTVTLKCEYLGDAHGMSVPDIVPGEQVFVYNHIGDDRFFWLPYREDAYLRLTEHHRISAMNKQENLPVSDPDADTWFMEVDSKHNRRIRLFTNQGREEAFGYTIEILPDDTTVEIRDTIGNSIMLESSNNHIKSKNADGSFTEIKGKNGKTYVPNNLQAEAGNVMEMKAGTHVDVEAPTINLLGMFNMYGSRAKSATNAYVLGNWKLKGSMEVIGPVKFIGNLDIVGNTRIVGNLTVTGHTTTGSCSGCN
jgi:hypothetical protein